LCITGSKRDEDFLGDKILAFSVQDRRKDSRPGKEDRKGGIFWIFEE
jgi:hypothetical protein